MDAVVLSYGDSIIRRSDVTLLEDKRWINDHIIGFVFEYFQECQFKSLSGDLCFVSPETTQCVKLIQVDDVGVILDPLEITRRQLVFFPLNDNMQNAAGGSHWSLLVLSVSKETCHHYDSCNSHNEGAARTLIGVLSHYLKINLKYKTASCPQQANNYDCGVYLISVAEHLATTYPKSELNDITASDAFNKRQQLKKLIDSLVTEQN